MVYKKKRTIGNLTVKFGWTFKRKGCNFTPIETVLVTNGTYSAHRDTFEDAAKALKRKIKKSNNKIDLCHLTLDTKINANMYQAITGACDLGTDSWLYDHGFTRRNKITVRELIPLLDDNDFGKDTFLKCVVQ